MDAGELDLVLAKRPAADDRGQLVWRDRLAWIGAPATRIDPSAPLPLILYNAPASRGPWRWRRWNGTA